MSDGLGRRGFFNYLFALGALGITSLLNFKKEEGFYVGKRKSFKVGVSEASAASGAGSDYAGGRGLCGAGLNCAGGQGYVSPSSSTGTGMCGAGLNCAGGGGLCGAGLNCAGGGGVCGAGLNCAGN
jgi:hypothetical protein